MVDAACGGYTAVRAAGVDLVIAETTITYRRPIRLGDLVTVHTVAQERGTTSITLCTDLLVQDRVCVAGRSTFVCVGPDGPSALPGFLSSAVPVDG